MRTSWSWSGFVFVDKHYIHVTRAFICLKSNQSIYVIVEPSDASMQLQVADVGINRFIKEQYSREYTSSKCGVNLTGGLFDNGDRIACRLCTIQVLKDKSELIERYYATSGLSCGYKYVASHFLKLCFMLAF